MRVIKRRNIGAAVAVDVTGTGQLVFGTITQADEKTTTIKPVDGSELVVVPKSVELFKASDKDLAQAFDAATGSELAESMGDDDSTYDEASDEFAKLSRSIVPQNYRETYVKVKGPNGRTSLSNNDQVAQELEGMDLAEVKAHVAKRMGTSAAAFTKRWGHLNNGQQRMLIGNAYRKAIANGEVQ